MPSRHAALVTNSVKTYPISATHSIINNFDFVDNAVGIDADAAAGTFTIKHTNGHMVYVNVSFMANADELCCHLFINSVEQAYCGYGWGLVNVRNDLNLVGLLELNAGDVVTMRIKSKYDNREITIHSCQFLIVAV